MSKPFPSLERLNDDNIGDWESFTPTLEQIGRREAWLSAYVTSVVDHLIESGQIDPDDSETKALVVTTVSEQMSATSRQDWMPPLRAQGEMAAITGSLVTDPARRQDMADAIRTMCSLSDHEGATVVAHLLGITVYSAKRYIPDRMDRLGLSGRTCLYRYFDEAGTLLYVGIAKDPEARKRGHRVMSEWFTCANRRDDIWFDTRELALAAERLAIKEERPLFNRCGSVVDSDDAEDYLFFRHLAAEVAEPIG